MRGGAKTVPPTLALRSRREREWPLKKIAAGFIASVLPFGTFIFDANLRREVNAEAEEKEKEKTPRTP